MKRPPLTMQVVIGGEPMDEEAWVRDYCRAILGLHGIPVPPEQPPAPKESAV
jgi:hypothetical protein